MLLSHARPELIVPRPLHSLPPSGLSRSRGRTGTGLRGKAGVRAAAALPALATVGPFPGAFQLSMTDLERRETSDTDCIKVRYSGGSLVCDGPGPRTSTPDPRTAGPSPPGLPLWLGELRAARDRHEQNTEAVRDGRGAVYVRTVREVAEGEELLVWYGDELARESGIPVLTPNNIRGNQQYVCNFCLKSYKFPNQLKIHIRFLCPRAQDVTPSGGAASHLLEAYYRHALVLQTGRDVPRSAMPSPTETLMRPTRDITSTKVIGGTNVTSDAALFSPHSRGVMSPVYGLPLCVGGQMAALDPALSLSLYRYQALYAQLYPHMANYGHQMTSIPAGVPSPPHVSPRSDLSPGSVPSMPPKEMSPPALSPLGFPLPSETAGEPLDMMPRSLYTSKHRKGNLCIYCGKLYSRKYGLKIHLRMHTGYKPLKCKVCQRPFGDPSNLNKHIRLHAEGDTPYRCPHCGKVLVRRRDLERHIKSRHPDVDVTSLELSPPGGCPDAVTGSDITDASLPDSAHESSYLSDMYSDEEDEEIEVV